MINLKFFGSHMYEVFNEKIRLNLISALILLYIIRIAFPYVNYIFSPFLAITSLYTILVVFRKGFQGFIVNFINISVSLLVSLFILVINYIFFSDYNKILTIEILHSISSFIILGIILVFIHGRDELDFLLKKLRNLLIVSSGIIGLAGITKLVYEFKGHYFDFLNIVEYPKGTSLTIDANFFSLFMLFGIVLLLPILAKRIKLGISIVYQLILIILTLNVLLSVSRRGLLVAIFSVTAILLIWALSIIYSKNEHFNNFRKNTSGYLALLTLSLLFIFYFLFFIPTIKRNELLVSSPFTKTLSEYLTSLVFKTQTIYKDSASYFGVKDKLWKGEFDPKYPYSGWGIGNYTPVYSIEGENHEIVPKTSVGYMLDKTANCSSWSGNSYFYNSVYNGLLQPNKKFVASVYCFVSEDFNGDWVRINGSGNLRGILESYYDISKKGEWQKLEAYFTGGKGGFSVYLYFAKNNSLSFDSLTGQVIFAYPEVKEIPFDPSDPDTYLFEPNYKKEFPLSGNNSEIIPRDVSGFRLDKSISGKKWTDVYFSRIILHDIDVNEGDSIKGSVFCYVSEEFNGYHVRLELKGDFYTGNYVSYYSLNHKGIWQKLQFDVIARQGSLQNTLLVSQKNVDDFSNLQGYVIFAYPQLWVKRESQWLKASQLVGLVAEPKIVASKAGLSNEIFDPDIEQITDSLHISGFKYTPSTNFFSGPRLDRWRYAWYLYTKEYMWWQKIVGGGFEHTNKFAKTFDSPKGYDYPHNPFISVLLYSGIIGLLAYFWLLYKVFFYYWLYRKEYWPWFLCFLATFFYSFFSANSPFDPAVMALFMVLPFAIHAIYIKGELEKTDD